MTKSCSAFRFCVARKKKIPSTSVLEEQSPQPPPPPPSPPVASSVPRSTSQPKNPPSNFEMSIQESPSYRVEDGMLLTDETSEAAVAGGDQTSMKATLPSTSSFIEDDETLVDLPAPVAEAGVPEEILVAAATDSPCELDRMGECMFPGKIAQCKHSKYKQTSSSKFVKDVMKPSMNDDKAGGLIWKANIVPDDFDKNYAKNKTLKMCSVNHYDAKNGCIKPRRGNLLVKESDFFGSLVQFNDRDEHEDDFDIFDNKDRWVFSGVLCGFPSLQTLEVLKIEYKRSIPLSNWSTHWKSGQDDCVPTFPKGFALSEVRVVLRSPPYTMNGWARDSRGFVFWFELENEIRKTPRVTYGTNIIRQFQKDSFAMSKAAPKCNRVHMISHRYATGDSQQIRDRFTYHSLALLEWDHGKYCTVVELAYLGGIGGYLGRSNWVEDKNEPVNSLYKALPPEMIHPWKSNLSEIRVFDVKARNLDEHIEFMSRHTGQKDRFLDVKVTLSHPVRLTFSSREDIAQYLINYISRGKTYSEIRANCQTFAADFCAFLAGKKDVQPYHPINRVQYHNQSHYFLYDPSMYHH